MFKGIYYTNEFKFVLEDIDFSHYFTSKSTWNSFDKNVGINDFHDLIDVFISAYEKHNKSVIINLLEWYKNDLPRYDKYASFNFQNEFLLYLKDKYINYYNSFTKLLILF